MTSSDAKFKTLLNYISDIKLQEVHTVKDLGVTFGEQLKFVDHCYDKIKKAYSILGLIVRRCRYDVRKYSFYIRITNVWNSLPDEIISAPSVNTFKNRLDKFWAEHEFFLQL